MITLKLFALIIHQNHSLQTHSFFVKKRKSTTVNSVKILLVCLVFAK